MSEYSVICGRQLIRSHCRAFSLLFPCSSSSLSLSFSPCMWLPHQLPCVSISFGVTLHTQALPNYNSTFGLLFVPIIYFSTVCYLIWVHIFASCYYGLQECLSAVHEPVVLCEAQAQQGKNAVLYIWSDFMSYCGKLVKDEPCHTAADSTLTLGCCQELKQLHH